MKSVPALITFDVDPAPELEEGFDRALELLSRHHITATFFFTASVASPALIQRVLALGHEIGCHGLDHGLDEEYQRLDITEQRRRLSAATHHLRQLVAKQMCTFRAPRVKVSATTLMILEELGYRADSSVCSQRLDFLSSNLINLGWLCAPRRPYHPHHQSPYRTGTRQLWEIPVSACMLPLISTTMRVFGVTAMQWLFALLHREAQWTGKPIVYLVHPHEFAFRTTVPFAWRQLRPSRHWRTLGLPIRSVFTRRQLGPEICTMHDRLFSAMRERSVEFLTMSQYLDQYLDTTASAAS